MTDYTVGIKQNEIVGRVHSGLQVVSSSAFTFLTFSNIYQLWRIELHLSHESLLRLQYKASCYNK